MRSPETIWNSRAVQRTKALDGAVRKLDALGLPGGTGGEENEGRVFGAH